MRFFKFILIGLLGMALLSFRNDVHHAHTKIFSASDTFPVPPTDDNLLFYVQRTPNTNTIIYELNEEPDGTINKDEPVHVFWIRYKEDGSKEELSYLQRKYAYGIKSIPQDKEKLSYKLHFVSYSKRYLYLQKSTHDKKYHVYTHIAGKWSILRRIFINIEGGTFWLPNISKVEMYGKETSSGKAVTEIFKP